MGGQRFGKDLLEWAHEQRTFTLEEVMNALDLEHKQARTALRRFVNAGKLEQIGTHEWRVNARYTSSNGDAGHAGDNYDSPARRAREATRSAAAITFEQVDIFTDGASLLRSDDGEFYRGYITKLD